MSRKPKKSLEGGVVELDWFRTSFPPFALNEIHFDHVFKNSYPIFQYEMFIERDGLRVDDVGIYSFNQESLDGGTSVYIQCNDPNFIEGHKYRLHMTAYFHPKSDQ
jgi:hypothetical protein